MSGATRSNLMFKACMPFSRLRNYLSHLQKNDMIYYNEKTLHYKTTEAGIRFLRLYEDMSEIINRNNNQCDTVIAF